MNKTKESVSLTRLRLKRKEAGEDDKKHLSVVLKIIK